MEDGIWLDHIGNLLTKHGPRLKGVCCVLNCALRRGGAMLRFAHRESQQEKTGTPSASCRRNFRWSKGLVDQGGVSLSYARCSARKTSGAR